MDDIPQMRCGTKARIDGWLRHSSLEIHFRPHRNHTVYTRCPKNDTALVCHNFNLHQPILIIFGRNVAKKVRNCTLLSHLTELALLHYLAKPANTKIASFYSNAVLLFQSSTSRCLISSILLNCNIFMRL